MPEIEVSLSSPPDRERLVADILVDHIQLAEINLEGHTPEIELYPRPDGLPWRIGYWDLCRALVDAGERLEAVLRG